MFCYLNIQEYYINVFHILSVDYVDKLLIYNIYRLFELLVFFKNDNNSMNQGLN